MSNFDKKLFKKTGYKITFDPLEKESAFIRKTLIDIHDEVIYDNSSKTARKLEKLMAEYPSIPTLKNFLYNSYSKLGKHDLARQTLILMNNAHPDYLFGKFNKALDLIKDKKFEEVKTILGENLEISDIVVSERVLHFSEYLGYYEVVGIWHNDQGDTAKAEDCFNKMCEVDKSNRMTVHLGQKIIEKRFLEMKNSNDSLKTRTVKTFSKVVYKQKTKSPIFNHTEIELLYQSSFENMDKDWIEIILSLPRQTLIEDLENTLEDAIYRYEYFKNKEWDDNLNFFPLHAIAFLCHLQSVESLPKISNFLLQGEDFVEFWLGDYSTESMPYALMMLGLDIKFLPNFRAFVVEKNVYTFAKTAYISFVEQIAQHQPENRIAVLAWFEGILQEMIDNQADDDLIDTMLILDLLSSLNELRAVELKDLFGKTLATFPELNNEFRNWEDELNRIHDPYYLMPIPLNLEEFYTESYYSRREKSNRSFNEFDDLDKPNHLMDLMFDAMKGFKDREEELEYSYPKNQQPILNEVKIGRNDPCHCGSGKKYKKCHGE
jgi:uncharacterized protein YecA (UPF0149 family)